MTNIIYPSNFVIVDVSNNATNKTNWDAKDGDLTNAYIFEKIGTNIVDEEGETLLYNLDLDFNTLIYPSSAICFTKDNKVNTNKGYVYFDKVDKDIHTINGNKIEYVTETKYLDDKLVLIRKNALGQNKPSMDTIITPSHGVYFNRKLIPARKLIPNNAEYISYSGEILYNILLKNKGMMKVNNLLVETLNPNNATAKLFTAKASLSESDYLQYIKEHDKHVSSCFKNNIPKISV